MGGTLPMKRMTFRIVDHLRRRPTFQEQGQGLCGDAVSLYVRAGSRQAICAQTTEEYRILNEAGGSQLYQMVKTAQCVIIIPTRIHLSSLFIHVIISVPISCDADPFDVTAIAS